MSYFDYEKISDYLPGDGEAIIVSRKDGELEIRGCPYMPEDLSADHESMGVLLIANEKISAISGSTFYGVFVLTLLACGTLWHSLELGFAYWWLYLSISVTAFGLQAGWISAREARVFRNEIEPKLSDVRMKQRLTDPAFLSVLKQMPELQSLAAEYQEHLADLTWKERVPAKTGELRF